MEIVIDRYEWIRVSFRPSEKSSIYFKNDWNLSLLIYIVAISYNLHSLKLKINSSRRLNRQDSTYRW